MRLEVFIVSKLYSSHDLMLGMVHYTHPNWYYREINNDTIGFDLNQKFKSN